MIKFFHTLPSEIEEYLTNNFSNMNTDEEIFDMITKNELYEEHFFALL